MSQIIVSKNNSTEFPLTAGATFTGDADVVVNFQEIDIISVGSPNVAPGILCFEFSIDGNSWDVTVPLTVTGPNSIPITLRIIMPYFRVKYTNGNTALTELRLYTIFHRENSMRLTRFLSQQIENNESLELVRVAKSTLPDGAASESTLATINSKTVEPIQKTLFDLESTTVNYIGTAPLGTAAASPVWRIKKMTFDVDGNLQSVLWTGVTAVWDNRASETYL